MKTTTTQIIGYRDCKYRLNGENLANMRRAQLSRLAKSFGIQGGDPTKNELLIRLISKLNLMDAEPELTDLLKGPPSA